MKYKIDYVVSKITSPISLIFPDGSVKRFADGEELSRASFDNKYCIDTISAVGGNIELKLKEETNDYLDREASALFDGA